MAIPTRLSRKLQESLGEEEADDFVDWMVQMEDRRSELHAIVEASRVATDARFAEFSARMDLRFSEMDRRLDGRFAEVDRRMDAGFAEQREAMTRLEVLFERRFGDLLKWSFVFWCGAVGAVAMLARAFR
jgi:hypothetical protein